MQLSKNEDFSTQDLEFDRSDVLFVRLFAEQVDYTDLTDNEFILKPDQGGNEVKTLLTNHLDGVYSLALDLNETDDTRALWEVRVRIKDRAGREAARRIDIRIGDGSSGNSGSGNNEVRLTGVVDSLATDGLRVDDLFFTVDSDTEIRDQNSNSIDLADISAGMRVEIRGNRLFDGGLLATRVEIERDRSNDDQVEFTGRIDAVSADSIVVAGVTFLVDDATVVLDDDRLPIDVGELFIGQIVEIRGIRANGMLVATDIKIEDDFNDEDEIEFTGVIEALGETTVTVNGVEFRVDDQTIVTDNDNRPIQFGALTAGLTVEIKGFRQADGSVQAVRIHVEDRGEDEVEFTGVIEQIDASSLTVAGQVFLVDETTVILDNDRLPIEFSALAVGMVVEIRGEIGLDGQLRATDIKIEDRFEDEVEVRATIDAVSAEEIVVLGQSFFLTGATQIFDNAGNAIGADGLATDAIVEVRADIQPGPTFIALRIDLENNDPDRVRVTGPADAVSTDQVIVAGIALDIDENTQVFDQNNDSVAPDALAAGQTLRVDATAQAAGPPLASRIEIKKAVRVIGAISSISTDVIVVAGASFTMEPTTLYLGFANAMLDFEDLSAGQRVEISVLEDAGSSLVTKVKVLSAEGSVITSIEAGAGETPKAFVLHANYPNPFNPTTTLTFDISHAAPAAASLTIYNALGQKVNTLVDDRLAAGRYVVEWDGRDYAGHPVASGLYLYRLQIDNLSETRTMTLIK